MRQANTTFVNLRAALDDLDPLVNTAKPATKNLAPFLPNCARCSRNSSPSSRNLRLTVARPGKANDTAELLAVLPTVRERASRAFPHSEKAIAGFQPNLNFIRAYTPDLFNGFGKLGQIAGYYDGNGHYVRAATAAQNLFTYDGGSLTRSPRRSSSTLSVPRPRSTAVAPAAPPRTPRRLQPLHRPARERRSVNSSECNPTDAPPGP